MNQNHNHNNNNNTEYTCPAHDDKGTMTEELGEDEEDEPTDRLQAGYFSDSDLGWNFSRILFRHLVRLTM